MNKPAITTILGISALGLVKKFGSKSSQFNDAFKRWFGNSKVVDSNGQPLVVYHGSPYCGFSEFRSIQDNGFIFFTDDLENALTYTNAGTRDWFEDEYIPHESDPSVIKYNPQEMMWGDFDEDLEDRGYYAVYLSIQNPLVVNANGKDWDSVPLKGEEMNIGVLCGKARDMGHDGVIVKNVVDSRDSGHTDLATTFVIFNPNQVKSVHNVGTWRKDTNNISLNRISK